MPEAALHVGSGKVRELYALDDERLLLVASDRISTFDVVLPTEIPDKGRVLTGLSAFWFARTRSICANHLLALRAGRPLDGVPPARDAADRVRRPRLPRRLRLEGLPRRPARSAATSSRRAARVGRSCRSRSSRLRRRRRPATTRTSRATQAAELVGAERLDEVERVSLALYRFAAEHAATRGIILADTKFEFGLDDEGRLVLGDEALTPDSSRFWPADEYAPGRRAAVVRQAVRARLLRDARLGQDRAGPGASGRRRRRHARALRRGVRAADRDPVRRLPRRPGGGARDEGDRARPPEGGHPRPAGRGGRELARHLGLRRRRGARRPRRRPRGRRRPTRRGARGGRAHVRAAAREPADRELRDRARRSGDVEPAAADRASSSSRARTTTATRCWALAALGAEAVPVWHARRELPDVDAVVLPGGFSYGDYLRCGAIARFSPAMGAVARVRRRRAGPCSGSATASRSSARRACCPACSGRTRRSRSSAATSPLASSATDTPFTARCEPGQQLVDPGQARRGLLVRDDELLAELEATTRSSCATRERQPERLGRRRRRRRATRRATSWA